MTRFVALALLVAGQAVGQSPEPATIHLAPIVPPSIRLLSQPSVRDDVGLSPRHKEAIEALQAAWAVPSRVWMAASIVWITPEIARAVIDERTQDFFNKELTPAQRKRLDQIVFQLKEREFGAHAAFAMASSELGLRAEQKDDVHTLKGLRIEEIAKHVTSGDRFEKIKGKVETTNGDTVEKMTEMLSRMQREKLNELKGKAFGGRLDLKEVQARVRAEPSYPPALFGMYDLELRYVLDPSIRRELKLTFEQNRDLAFALVEWEPGVRDGRIVAASVESQHALTEKALKDHLTAEQRTRFEQIMMQRRALVGPAAMCGHPAAVAALKLSPIQLRQLRDGEALANVLSTTQMIAREQLLGPPFVLPKGVKDPYIAFDEPKKSDPSDMSFARSMLVLTNRLKLNAEQIKKLRELAEDEPKIIDLIQHELSLADTPPVVGTSRYLTAAGAVTDQYKVAVEEQCWNVLDAVQQSLARKIFGRGK